MVSRRQLLSALGAVPLTAVGGFGQEVSEAWRRFHHRQLGRTGHWVVPLGLGGQASLQWTPDGVDAADIVVRAIEFGVNYLDTGNDYGPSQKNFRQAFERLRLIPRQQPFNGALRERLFLTSKTRARFSLDPAHPSSPTAVTELKRALSELFGDGQGSFPEGAYLDCMQVEDIATLEDVDQIYEGLSERGSGKLERVGALAGLRDYRDGTDYTGLNPNHRIRLKHIGITGHRSSLVLMNALQRDTEGLLDTLLVALNANDRRYCAHQNNVLPLAVAKGLGVVAMKAFANGVFYGKAPQSAPSADDVVLSVGGEDSIRSRDLVRYPTSLTGVACTLTGIGHIDRDKLEKDQIAVNLEAAVGDLASLPERLKIERELRNRGATRTNYFQDPPTGLLQPGDVKSEKDGDYVRVTWTGALAGSDPIGSYLVMSGERVLLSTPFRPQTTLEPHSALVPASELVGDSISVVASTLPAWVPRPTRD